jgi:hypothetical protein
VATQENLDAIVERLNSLDGYRTMLAALPPDTMHANPDTMVDILTLLRSRWGTIDDYAGAAGLPPGIFARLRARLLEP